VTLNTSNDRKTSIPVDPVCGMPVNPESAAGSYEHESKPYYFCSTHCLHKFGEDPERYLNKVAEPMPVQPTEFNVRSHPQL
jgi:Cu+-exporting ATPase